jgi:hypothetical protein
LKRNCTNAKAKPSPILSTPLPPPQSDLAEQTLKDPYNFDFLTLHSDAHERDLEKGLSMWPFWFLKIHFQLSSVPNNRQLPAGFHTVGSHSAMRTVPFHSERPGIQLNRSECCESFSKNFSKNVKNG